MGGKPEKSSKEEGLEKANHVWTTRMNTYGNILNPRHLKKYNIKGISLSLEDRIDYEIDIIHHLFEQSLLA